MRASSKYGQHLPYKGTLLWQPSAVQRRRAQLHKPLAGGDLPDNEQQRKRADLHAEKQRKLLQRVQEINDLERHGGAGGEGTAARAARAP